MKTNFVLIHTGSGASYSRRIGRSIEWINKNKYKKENFSVQILPVNELHRIVFPPESTLIHSRAAHPDAGWMDKLIELENSGHTVINSTNTLRLTSDKLACSLHLQGKVNHPKTVRYFRDSGEFSDDVSNFIDDIADFGEFIAKPVTSISQGQFVRKIKVDQYPDEIMHDIEEVPGDEIVLQELIPYTALHRVVVVGGKALPYTFIDKPEWHQPGDWKVSCCLNKTTMQLDEYPSPSLLELAEQTQREVNGMINFIDIFEYKLDIDNRSGAIIKGFTISEINTACNLRIHEKLARVAGRPDWNIHYRIARFLIERSLI